MLAVAAFLARTATSRAPWQRRLIAPPVVHHVVRAVSSSSGSFVSDDAGPRNNNQISSQGLGQRLREVARTTPDKIAVVTASGEQISYGSLMNHAEQLAGRLRAAVAMSTAMGVDIAKDAENQNFDDGDVVANILVGACVAISAVPGPEFVAAMHAAWLCGAIAVPIPRNATKDETQYVLQDAEVSIFALINESTEMNEKVGDASDGTDLHAESFEAMDAAGVPSMILIPPVPRNDEVSSLSVTLTSSTKQSITSSDDEDTSNPPSSGALIIYTSGTTGSPKGVLHTHGTLFAQCQSLCTAWEWSPDDLILHCLPLHHIHGIVNAWLCAHFVGATVEFGEFKNGFSPRGTWRRLREGILDVDDALNPKTSKALINPKPPITVFMAVPTMYVMLLKTLQAAKRKNPEIASKNAKAANSLRLAVSGSAACPKPVMNEWQSEANSEILLERYGMTEIGMALSNPLHALRIPGTVGVELPGVETKLIPLQMDDKNYEKNVFGDDGNINRFDSANGPGELCVKGPGVFVEYWGRESVTKESFTDDGFFKTGDAVERVRVSDTVGESTGGSDATKSDSVAENINFVWKILGRTSVDVLKTGGFKVSALEVEAKLLEHPVIVEIAVVGVPCANYGEKGVAIVVLSSDEEILGDSDAFDEKDDDSKSKSLRAFARQKMAEYKVPQEFIFVDAIPRNVMGKVNKKSLKAELDLLSDVGIERNE